MKYKLIALVGLAVVFSVHTPAYANNCDEGCYSYYDQQTDKTIQIPLIKEDQETHATWYQSMVGIPVWNAPLMGDGSKPIPPEGPWVTSDMLPKQPIPHQSIAQYKGTQTPQFQPVEKIVIVEKPITKVVIDSPIINTTTTVNNSTTINYYAKIMADYQKWLDEINKWFYLTFGYKLGGNK
jgi:hypothetical protein